MCQDLLKLSVSPKAEHLSQLINIRGTAENGTQQSDSQEKCTKNPSATAKPWVYYGLLVVTKVSRLRGAQDPSSISLSFESTSTYFFPLIWCL